VHPAGESSLVDRVATFEKYRAVHAAAASELEREATYLRNGGFAAVVSDIAPLPLRAARRAGLPGILIANFTWHDIFRPYARGDASGFRDMLRDMQLEYSDATVYLRSQPAIAGSFAAPVQDIGLVTTEGRERRGELIRVLGLGRHARLVYVYVGRYGQADMEWQNLRRLESYEFVSYHSIPEQSSHWHVVDPKIWSPGDLAASVDVMLAKAGYGTVSDAMVNRTPLIFPPRHGFAEHRILAGGLLRWGSGIPIGTRQFKTLAWRAAIERALSQRPKAAPWPTDGALRCARQITRAALPRNRVSKILDR
jgi:hypothetical protein